ncbi:putative Ulp1 protease family catalytic domain-containing protein [Rosa chinensis]|uniref:Putative Ulp1 protease family catalytic domain-containing protein n=1 Tax=Rosa chinensis TaxID=74649 RepID=A0A2P6PEI7_ROSCH|nr:putative Ulp1 protease family catalytic domain-containing protein [Rosa chinensis]
MEDKVFGINKNQYVFKADIHALCTMGELSGGVICMYMLYLHEVLKRAKMSEMVGCVDPSQLGALGCGNPTERSRHLANRFQNAKKWQIFMLPYNAGKHWMLTVVNPDEETIYFMDPLRRRLIGDEWEKVVENGIKIYNAHRNRSSRKSILWQNMAGIPVQQTDKDCAIFIMRFMKEIVEDRNLQFASKWQRRSSKELVYTQKDLDAVRIECLS